MDMNKRDTKILQNKITYVTILISEDVLQKVLQNVSADCFLTLGLYLIEIL
jgi:hypothetical protein